MEVTSLRSTIRYRVDGRATETGAGRHVGARGVEAARLSTLVREREAVKRELHTWLERALDQTAGPRD